MISVNETDALIKRAWRELAPGDYLHFLTAKKDRSVKIVRTREGFLVTEQGFEHAQFTVCSEQDLKKCFKRLRQIEFPRSNQLYCQRGTEKTVH